MTSGGRPRVFSGGGECYGAKDYRVHVWDAVSGAQLAVLQGHSDTVWCITLSSDGHFAASASSDKTVCVWDLASFSLCARLKGHMDDVNSVLFI